MMTEHDSPFSDYSPSSYYTVCESLWVYYVMDQLSVMQTDIQALLLGAHEACRVTISLLIMSLTVI